MLNRMFISLILMLTQISCSQIETIWGGDRQDEIVYHQILPDDYVAHLQSLANDYTQNSGVATVTLSETARNYLEGVYKKLVRSNELLLDQEIVPRFFVVKDTAPFYFSLPGGNFFFSLGLIKRYFKHEDFLVAALSTEVVKSHRKIYAKKAIIPVGYLSTERIISLTKIPLDLKNKINKWGYHVMTRAGFDGHVLLIWLQTVNRNSLEFSMIIGDAQTISQEESQMKTFVVSEGMIDWSERKGEYNSSKGFYGFINELEKVAL